jgi:nucleoside transporter|tara:strand:+ start:217 stop:1443 length:1227 start_codon:yes stop_codon:yes gene_type:complete
MNLKIKIQLSVMMFLEFFIWGAWFVTMGTFLSQNLSASGSETAMAYSTQSWGAIIAPFIIGLIADRFFNAERILAILHSAGGVMMLMMASAASFDDFYIYVLGYMVLYMPTLALVNSVSFFQMSEAAKEFSLIRVFGTVGWIVAGAMISYYFSWDSASAVADGMLQNTFLMAAYASFGLGIFSFFLPKTPPAKSACEKISLREILGLDALKLFNDRNYLVFFISSILICIPLAFYYQHANPFLTDVGLTNPTGKMALGQVSEVIFMLLLPYFLLRLGLKKTLIIGMLAWVLRYILFAYGDADEKTYMLIFGILLHGICYDFFFVTGQVYTDAKAGPKIKSATQGLITLATYGLGMFVGFWSAGKIYDMYALDEGLQWSQVWIAPTGFAFVVLLIFLITFKNEKIDVNG